MPPLLTGLPSRKITAFSCGCTTKNPEARNTSTMMTSTTLTITKLLRSASESACEPASSVGSGGTGALGGVAFFRGSNKSIPLLIR